MLTNRSDLFKNSASTLFASLSFTDTPRNEFHAISKKKIDWARFIKDFEDSVKREVRGKNLR